MKNPKRPLKFRIQDLSAGQSGFGFASRHSGEGRNPGLRHFLKVQFTNWIPVLIRLLTIMPVLSRSLIPSWKRDAFAGMTILIIVSLPSFAAYSSIETPEDKILSKGFSAFMDGSDKQALSYFEEVIRINPQNKAAQKGLEKVKIRLKKIENENKEKSLRLAKAKHREGKEMMKSKDIVGAIDAYLSAVEAVPDFKPAKTELAHIKKDMQKLSSNKKLNLSQWSFSRGALAYLDRDWAKAWRIWSERSLLEPGNVVLANATVRAENNFKKMMVTEQEDFFRRGARAFYEQGLYSESQIAWGKVLDLREGDLEALEGKARSEEALLRAQGKGRDNEMHDLLERGLEFYASQDWRKSLEVFKLIADRDPEFSTAKEYIAKLNKQLEAPGYVPTSVSQGESWRGARPSHQGNDSIKMPEKLENYSVSKKELQSQLNRDPSNIRIQQELDRVNKVQDEEGERVYKDGLIAYSQGNRDMAIQYWKQVLVINPEHKKAMAALRKAQAEEDRAGETETQ
jgi:tetratricopeptide (TPR) repeat protein